MSAFPPQRSVASIPIPQEIALKYLSAYLSAAQSSPQLLPSARLEPSGPTSSPASSSITIHNLQRVEAGLRGEWIAPTLDLGEGQDAVPIADGMDDGTNKKLGEEAEGWMDLDEYQREQSIEGGTIGDGVVEAGEFDSDLEVDTNETNEHGEADARYGDSGLSALEKQKPVAVAKVSKKPIDKAARKAEKEQRKKQEKLDRAEARHALQKSQIGA